jgi:heterodisulfide reductase subunit A-like polyferredoxin/coenzyme F420-reducing hydrogenase delta subunit
MLAPEPKIGVFLYHKEKRRPDAPGGEDLKMLAGSFPGVEVVEDLFEDHWEASAGRLEQEIRTHDLSRLVFVSDRGSNRSGVFQKEATRLGLNPDQVLMVNVRPVFRGTEAEPELVRERSVLLLKQAILRLQSPDISTLEQVETIPRLLILGSGPTGRLAARETVRLGYEALVLEEGKESSRDGYYDQVSGLEGEDGRLSEMTAPPGVRLVSEAKLISLEGQAGRFTVQYLDGEDRVQEEAVGAVLVALAPEVKANFEDFDLKPSRRVLSLDQLEALLRSPEYREKLIPQGEQTEIVFFSGLAAESGPPVLARALGNARKIQGLENTQVYFLSGNLKVAAEGLERESTQAREEGVIFFRFTGQLPVVKATDSDLQVAFFDEIIDRSLILNPQVIVVDEDLLPHPWLKELSPILETPLDLKGFMVPDQVYALPVRAPRPGIYVVGGSRRPFPGPEEIRAEVEEAVLSAAELIGRGIREVESRVRVDRKKCTICLTCVRSCPHQAMHFVLRRPQAHPLACQVCGVCAAECPMDAIQIQDFQDSVVIQEISGNFTDRKFDTIVPQVVAFCCQNSAHKTLEQALLFREPLPIGFEFIKVPCAGKIDPDHVLHAFQEGADGVVVLACPIEGCKSFEGNKKARERVAYLREVLSELGLEPERIQFETVGPGMLAQLLKTCQTVDERIRKLGISPVRRAKGIQRIYDQFTFPVDSKTFVI